MLHQRIKDLCFQGIAKATLPNYYIRRSLSAVRVPSGDPLHLHLGCGPKYLPGFLNIDANPFQKLDLWLDVRNGLPFPDASVSSIYATHMLEHLYSDELTRLLAECVRVLLAGGGVRFIVPNLATATRAYTKADLSWFPTYPECFDSIGGRFSNFVFCGGPHRTAFDFDYMKEVLSRVGFREVFELAEGKSRLYGERVLPYDPADDANLPHSLYVEAFK